MLSHLTIQLKTVSKGDHQKNKTPDTKRLCHGPAAFGLTDDPEKSPADANDMYNFIGKYVARSEGVKRIAKSLKKNKGWTDVKNMMTVDQVTYAICSVDNHAPVWERDVVMRELDNEEEGMKYKNYSYMRPEEQEKYAPKETRHTSGKNIKEEYGVAVRSKEGKALYTSTRAN